jgi:catechol 2,3-dioxygenase
MPLDLDSLLGSVAGEDLQPQVGQGLRMGHVHLHAGDVERGLEFYRDLIGFELWAQLPTAAFVSAGGYHHHLAFNTWMGRGVGPAPEHSVGLHRWTVQLPAAADVEAVAARLEAAGLSPVRSADGFEIADPWDIPVRFEVAA